MPLQYGKGWVRWGKRGHKYRYRTERGKRMAIRKAQRQARAIKASQARAGKKF